MQHIIRLPNPGEAPVPCPSLPSFALTLSDDGGGGGFAVSLRMSLIVTFFCIYVTTARCSTPAAAVKRVDAIAAKSHGRSQANAKNNRLHR